MGNIFNKLGLGLVVGGVLVAIAHSQELPFSFQLLFFIISLVGATVFILLDGVHECIAHQHRQVEIFQRIRLAFRVDEQTDVGMIATQSGHH